jgi:hypothetical protein
LQPDDIDGRSRYARRFRRLCQEFETELGGHLSAADKAAIAQAVSFQMEEERLRAERASGADVDHDTIIRVGSEARRARAALKGKAEANKPAAPTALDQYLKAKYGPSDGEPEADEA